MRTSFWLPPEMPGYTGVLLEMAKTWMQAAGDRTGPSGRHSAAQTKTLTATMDTSTVGVALPAACQFNGPCCVISRINSIAAESRHAFCCSLVRYCSGFLLRRCASLRHLSFHFLASHERTSINQ